MTICPEDLQLEMVASHDLSGCHAIHVRIARRRGDV